MGDDLIPGSQRDGRDDADPAALEEELRALFAPVAAPHNFRERLKADLLHGNERLVLVAPVGPGEPRQRRATWRTISALATHPRAAMVAGTLAVAAVIVLALLLNADRFDLHTARSTLPRAETRTVTPAAAVAATTAPTPAATPPAPTTATAPSAPTLTRPTIIPATRAPIAATSHPVTTRPEVTPVPSRDVRASTTATPAATATATPMQPRPSPTVAGTSSLFATTPAPAMTVVAPGGATVPPAPTATSQPTPLPRPTATAHPAPHLSVPATRVLPPPVPATRVSPTRVPARPTVVPTATPSARPRHRHNAVIVHAPTPTLPVPSTATVLPTATATVRPSGTPRPTARPRYHHGHTQGAIPPLTRSHATPPLARTGTATPTPRHRSSTAPTAAAPRPAAPTAPARSRRTPIRPTATATTHPRATIQRVTSAAVASPAFTVTPRPTASSLSPTTAPTASASPTAGYNNVLNPNIQPSFPLPNPGNGVLNSPLQDALTADQTQNISESVPISWTLPQFLPQLPVYPIARAPVSGNDVVKVARELGTPSALDMVQQANGAITARVQVDGAPYTLTVYAGYGAPWFTLQAVAPQAGTISSVRLRDQAAAWLQVHNLLHPDMRLLSIADGVVQYGQTVSGTTVLGPTALSFSFDSRGALHDLTDEYIVPRAPFMAQAASSNNAASDAIGGQQGFYSGPPASAVTGPAAVNTLTLVYVGVQGTKNDYLEPVYVLSGDVPTSSNGPQPFAIYISALITSN